MITPTIISLASATSILSAFYIGRKQIQIIGGPLDACIWIYYEVQNGFSAWLRTIALLCCSLLGLCILPLCPLPLFDALTRLIPQPSIRQKLTIISGSLLALFLSLWSYYDLIRLIRFGF